MVEYNTGQDKHNFESKKHWMMHKYLAHTQSFRLSFNDAIYHNSNNSHATKWVFPQILSEMWICLQNETLF
jgi:hypothetical protein